MYSGKAFTSATHPGPRRADLHCGLREIRGISGSLRPSQSTALRVKVVLAGYTRRGGVCGTGLRRTHGPVLAALVRSPTPEPGHLVRSLVQGVWFHLRQHDHVSAAAFLTTLHLRAARALILHTPSK